MSMHIPALSEELTNWDQVPWNIYKVLFTDDQTGSEVQEEKYEERQVQITIRDRIVVLWDAKNLTARELEKASGIDRDKWYALRNGRRRANEEDIMAIVEAFPCHALWLVSGKVAPEIGQVSPEYEAARQNSADSPKAG